MSEAEYKKYLSVLHGYLLAWVLKDDKEAVGQAARRICHQKDERGFLAHVWIVASMVAIGEMKKEWKKLRSLDVSSWGAHVDWRSLASGDTALVVAARRGKWKAAAALLECGADPRLSGASGASAKDLILSSKYKVYASDSQAHGECCVELRYALARIERTVLLEASADIELVEHRQLARRKAKRL